MDKIETQTAKADPHSPEYPDLIGYAGKLLRDGGLVAFPTETVYGLAANAECADAMDRLRKVKGRPEGKPFTLLVADPAGIEKRVGRIPGIARALMDSFWPGPLTVVLRETGGGTAGFRMPDHRVALDLIRAAGVPLAAPSANASGSAEPRTAEDVQRQLGGKIPLILDGGSTRLGIPSTVVLVEDESYRVLRAGAVGDEQIRELLRFCCGNDFRRW